MFLSLGAPPGEDRHRDLQEIGEQSDAEHRDDGCEDEGAQPRRVAVTERGDEDAAECSRDHPEIASEDDEQDRTGENAGPAPPLWIFRQDTLVIVTAFR